MLRIPSAAILLLACASGCRGKANTDAVTTEQTQRPLAGFAALRLVVAPTSHVRAADSLGWVRQLGGTRTTGRQLDSALFSAFDARGVASRWIFPAELQKSFERNRMYASDPYQLVVEGIRGPSFKTGAKYGEPLSSQLRTMIALQEDARYVVLPLDLRFERDQANAGAGMQRAVVRLALIDPRFAEARWVVDLWGSTVATPTAALGSLAARLADQFVAP